MTNQPCEHLAVRDIAAATLGGRPLPACPVCVFEPAEQLLEQITTPAADAQPQTSRGSLTGGPLDNLVRARLGMAPITTTGD